VRAFSSSQSASLEDALEYSLQVVLYLVVADAEHMIAISSQILITQGVFLSPP